MTKKEYIEITKIMLTADGGCRKCAGDLIEQLGTTYPKLRKISDKLFYNKFKPSRKQVKLLKMRINGRVIGQKELEKAIRKTRKKLFEILDIKSPVYKDIKTMTRTTMGK